MNSQRVNGKQDLCFTGVEDTVDHCAELILQG